MVDVSDGLLADVGHIALASGVVDRPRDRRRSRSPRPSPPWPTRSAPTRSGSCSPAATTTRWSPRSAPRPTCPTAGPGSARCATCDGEQPGVLVDGSPFDGPTGHEHFVSWPRPHDCVVSIPPLGPRGVPPAFPGLSPGSGRRGGRPRARRRSRAGCARRRAGREVHADRQSVGRAAERKRDRGSAGGVVQRGERGVPDEALEHLRELDVGGEVPEPRRGVAERRREHDVDVVRRRTPAR